MKNLTIEGYTSRVIDFICAMGKETPERMKDSANELTDLSYAVKAIQPANDILYMLLQRQKELKEFVNQYDTSLSSEYSDKQNAKLEEVTEILKSIGVKS